MVGQLVLIIFLIYFLKCSSSLNEINAELVEAEEKIIAAGIVEKYKK